MDIVLLIAGIILYFITALDVFQTTLSMQGGGMLTSRLSHWFWTLLLKLSGGDGRKKILSHAGYFLLISIMLTWVLLLWTSFSLLLLSDSASIVNSTTKQAADIVEKIYYAGFTLSTLGIGDYIASSNLWRIVSGVYSFTGLILLTMSVTYFIPVLSAVIEQRKLGIRLSNLGSSPEEILLNSWNGKDFSRFEKLVGNISESIVHHSQNHRAYPVIHYFHNWKENNAVILQLARLNEALYLFRFEIDQNKGPEELKLKPLEVALENYREVITEVTHIKILEEAPPYASTQKLEKQGIFLHSRDSISVSKKVIETRKLFKTLVRQDGWNWDLV